MKLFPSGEFNVLFVRSVKAGQSFSTIWESVLLLKHGRDELCLCYDTLGLLNIRLNLSNIPFVFMNMSVCMMNIMRDFKLCKSALL
jgi:hypothetical protein